MAGHSHWANIKHKKARVDAKRAKVWGKIAKKIMVAAKSGPDVADNLALRYVVDEAKAANMPKDTIQKAIDKGSGALGADDYEEIVYEGYGPGGVAILLEILTDNRNRTAGEIRNTFDKSGGNLATSGSVAFQFEKKGLIAISEENAGKDEEALMDLALEAGAEDFESGDGMYQITTGVSEFTGVRDALDAAEVPVEDAALTNIAQNTVEVDGDTAAKVARLLDTLDDNDDVQTVSHNAELPEEVLS